MRSIRWRHAILAAPPGDRAGDPGLCLPELQGGGLGTAGRGCEHGERIQLEYHADARRPATLLTTGAFMVRRAVKLGTLPEL